MSGSEILSAFVPVPFEDAAESFHASFGGFDNESVSVDVKTEESAVDAEGFHDFVERDGWSGVWFFDFDLGIQGVCRLIRGCWR
jgi:hypothetical protein